MFVLTANDNLEDGIPTFHANHGNLAAVAGAPSIATLTEARTLLRSQTSVGGVRLLGAAPRALLSPAALETVSQQVVTSITPAQVTNANPFAGLASEVEARLDPIIATGWYLLASAPFFFHLNLAGQEFPLVQTDEAFYRDGVSLKIRNDFAVGINDYRGAVLNTG